MIDVINLVYLGHSGNEKLVAGVGMGAISINFMGWSVISGVTQAMDTLVSHAAGQKNYELCGVYLNRGRLVVTLIFIPTCIMSTQIKNAMIYFNQDKDVASYA
jgi:MATE family multidrug resistance protein